MADFSLQGSKELVYRITDFAGGLNTKFAKSSLAENEASDMMNMVIEERGSIYKRKGVKIASGYLSAPGKEIIKVDKFENRMKERINFIFYADGTIMCANPGGVIGYPMQFYDENGNATTRSTEKCSSFIFYDKYYFGNKVDGWFRFEPGHHAFKVAGIPKAEHAIINNNRVYYANIDEQADRMYFSHQGNCENVSLVPGDQEAQNNVGGLFDFPSAELPITGISVFQGSLLVFKKDAVFSLTGYDYTDFEIKQLTVSTGCAVSKSVTLGDNQVYYIGYDGVYSIFSPSQDVVNSTPVSYKITPEFDSYNKDKLFCFHHKSKLYLLMEDRTLIYDERLGSWTKWDTKFTCAMYEEDLDKIVFGGTYGYVYTLENELFDQYDLVEGPKGIRGMYSTPYFSFGEPEITKKYKWVKVFYKPNPIEGSKIKMSYDVDYTETWKDFDAFFNTLLWSEDFVTDQDIWGEYWGDVRAQMSKKVRFSKKGAMVRLTFENDAIGEELGLSQLVFGYKRKEKVK